MTHPHAELIEYQCFVLIELTLFPLLLCPAVFQPDGAVEYQVTLSRVLIDTEVADALELVLIAHLGGIGQERLNLGIGDDAQ